jgi:hypothetical protein
LSPIRKTRLGPGLFDDVEDLQETLAALGVGHAISLIGLRDAAAADAENQPTATQLIDRGGRLGQAQRMAERQNLDGDADLDAPGAGGDRAGNAERRRQQRTVRLEMQLGQPHHIEPQPLSGIDLGQRLLKGLVFAAPRK